MEKLSDGAWTCSNQTSEVSKTSEVWSARGDLICRLLPYEIADGPTNMAADEVLLHTAVGGLASLRFYGWSPPTLSLGYFQSEKPRHADSLLCPLPFVRRPSGGATLVHHHELTYALALPAGAWHWRADWPMRMHEIIVTALASFAIDAGICATAPQLAGTEPLCFHCVTAGDVTLGGAKVVGSAQRKHRGAVLQHGSILLAQSPSTPSLPGIYELTGRKIAVMELAVAVQRAFVDATGAGLTETPFATEEKEELAAIKASKYDAPAWNCKR